MINKIKQSFMIIFLETGAVILAVLPGDSLLVGAGAFAASGDLELCFGNAIEALSYIESRTIYDHRSQI